MISPLGTQNTTSQIVPGLNVQIAPPRVTNLNGVPSNKIGVVGSASFGPVNTPVAIGSMAQFERVFGKLNARNWDLGTQVAAATQQGANTFICVRVADAAAAAATGTVAATGLTLTAKHTGTQGNKIKIVITAGSKANSFRAVISIPGIVDEAFDNITGAANAFWVNLAAAINSGTNQRGPSELVTAVQGALTSLPTPGVTATLTGGNDGHVDAETDLIGIEASKSGMYALAGSGASIGLLADCYSPAALTAMTAFGLSEGIYFIAAGPSGETITAAKTAKATNALDTYAVKMMLGDHLYWSDPTNSVVRLVSPAPFVAGVLANRSPERSSLNQAIYGVIGSQKAGLQAQSVAGYTQAELQELGLSGIDVVANPAPGGAFWACRLGCNASSDANVNSDNYTRLINYFAKTVDAGMGKQIGKITNTDTMRDVTSTLNAMLNNALSQGLLSPQIDGKLPYRVVCDASNNPVERTRLGYLQADVQIQFGAITRFFNVAIEGGQTVVVAN